MIRHVTVFGASNRAGQAQISELLKQGYQARAITRNPEVFDHPDFAGVEIISADYNDPPSLDRALQNTDAVFYQPPSMGSPGQVKKQSRALLEAVLKVPLQRFVLNSMMWVPDNPPCGEPYYDHVRRIEDLFAETTLPLVILRPVLFMDNLQTVFARKPLVEEGVFRYCHRPGLKATWICFDDVAKFMVEALKRDELVGERLTIGGPETLPVEEVLAILSDVMGRKIRHEFVEPRAFGTLAHAALAESLKVSQKSYEDFFDSFYGFNNYSPLKPFEVDMAPVLKRIPLELMTFREWAARQDWTQSNESARLIGSLMK